MIVGAHFSWYPITPTESLEDVVKTYIEWPDSDDPRQHYLREKWFKTVNQPRSIASLDELLSQYLPSIDVRMKDGSRDYYLPVSVGEYPALWLSRSDGQGTDEEETYRDVTIRLGSLQQGDEKVLDKVYHFLAYLALRGHGLVLTDYDGWTPLDWLRERGEKFAPIPPFKWEVKNLRTNAQESYNRWKKKE